MSWLTIEDRDRVRILTMDRPERKNAIPAEGFADLAREFEAFETSDQRVLIVTGANGEFSAGADLDPALPLDAGVAQRQRRMKTVGGAALLGLAN